MGVCMRPHLFLLVAGLAVSCIGSATALVDGGSAEAELIKNVQDIRQAQVDLQVIDDFLPCGDEATAKAAASQLSRSWDGPDCFVRIGWAPTDAVRGGYFVTVAADQSDFEVVGLADTDGDGTFMRVEASKDQAARVVSPAEVR